MIPTLLSEKKVDKTLAILAVVFSLLAGLVSAIGLWSVMVGIFEGFIDGWRGYGYGTGRIFGGFFITLISGLLGILAGIFTLIVLNQWSGVLNENIQNTKVLLSYLKQKVESEKQMNLSVLEGHLSTLNLNIWAYWVYLVFYVISFLIPVASFVFSILAIVFLSVYLQSVFSVSKRLEEIKNAMYPLLGISFPMMSYIKQRNVGIFILLTIVTLGIYWWYLLIKLSDEINQYIDADQKIRQVINL
ncbi:MAG TPA: DUF4234 domain-containing protein [Pseudothermotoga sp.]|nr:DUF4234 domain-containing protein [Pseudothermotoga sp.]HOK83337.1 DUF4234 domain-containing protein [Pseudothermotoga sp.]HPP70162.1 DUF4234 domain-containing protein [Pseudothermotoga sp.]